jgi:hypothetical protein
LQIKIVKAAALASERNRHRHAGNYSDDTTPEADLCFSFRTDSAFETDYDGLPLILAVLDSL